MGTYFGSSNGEIIAVWF